MSIEIPDAKGQSVTDADGNTEEYLQVQNGPSLNRDGGPYGDQSDAIRDEKQNAAREGRAPNFDSLVPDQYRVEPKSVVAKSTFPDVGSLTRIVEPQDVTVGESTADYSKGEIPEDNSTVVKPSEPGEPVNSESVAKAYTEDDLENL